MFKSSIYKTRRSILTGKLKTGVVFLLGNTCTPLDYHANTYPFHQDDTFRYYLGIDKAYLAAVIDIDSGETVLFGTEQTINDKIWTGEIESLKDFAKSSGVEIIKDFLTLKTYLSIKSKGRTIHHIPYARTENRHFVNEIIGIYKPSQQLVNAIIEQRLIKSEEEIAEIEWAVTASGKINASAREIAVPGAKESDILSKMLYETSLISSKPSFQPIITVRGETLHKETYNNLLKANDMLLIDFGIFSPEGYSSDNTRVFPIGGTFTTLQKDIYSIVLNMQLNAIKAVKPGVKNLDVHMKACETLVENFKDLGILKGNTSSIVETGTHALFFVHGIGHLLGLNTHDMEGFGEDLVGYGNELKRSSQFGLQSLRLARTLQEGFVITIEPGIYFIPRLIDLWQSEGKCKEFINYNKLRTFRNFGGIRIEDDLLVTSSGSRILGNHLAK